MDAQTEKRTELIHRAFLVRGLLLENVQRGVTKIPLETMTTPDITTLLMDFIHYNQYVTMLRISLEKNKKAYRRALKKKNKQAEIQQYEEAQKWITEALDSTVGQFYEENMRELLIAKVNASSCEKPEFVSLSLNEKMGVVFHTCLDIVQRQWTSCGIMTPVVQFEDDMNQV